MISYHIWHNAGFSQDILTKSHSIHIIKKVLKPSDVNQVPYHNKTTFFSLKTKDRRTDGQTARQMEICFKIVSVLFALDINSCPSPRYLCGTQQQSWLWEPRIICNITLENGTGCK
uniref:Uncharacterized protein n=2 Tax=Anguilla anguilla TaxID=7936 RepID=A0A0E9TBF8_ANGAN